MVMPTGQEMPATEKIVYYNSQEGRRHTIQGHMGKHQAESGGRRRRGNVSTSLYCGLCRKGSAKQGKQA